MRIPITIQMHPGENGMAVISSMLGAYGKYVPLSSLRETVVTSRNGSTPQQLADAAAIYGLKSEISKVSKEDLPKQSFPLIASWRKKYYCIIKRIIGNSVYLMDPAKGDVRMNLEYFLSRYSGVVIKMEPTESFEKGGKRESIFSLITSRLKGMRAVLIRLTILNVVSVLLNLVLINSQRIMLDLASGSPVNPKLTAMFHDSILTELIKSDRNSYILIIIVMDTALVLYTIANITKTLYIYKAAYEDAAGAESRLFKKLFAQPLQFFEQYSIGELMQRIDGNKSLSMSLLKSIIPRFLDLVMVVVYVFQGFMYHKILGAICLAIEIIYLIISGFLQRIIADKARVLSTATNSMNSTTINGLGSIETIKSGGVERAYFATWNEEQRLYRESRFENINITQLSSILGGIHTVFSQGVVLFVGAYFIIQGSFTLGTLAALQSILVNLRSSLSNCTQTVNSLQGMRTTIERIDDIEKRPVKEEIMLREDDNAQKFAGDIEVSHLVYQYNKGDAPALNDVSFSVKAGEIIAIVGESGCGKSTLLKCLGDMYKPSSGTILYGGMERKDIPDVVFSSSINMVNQEIMMFEDTIMANMTLWDSTIANYDVIMAANEAQIHKRILKDRDGYYAMVRESGKNFSGGELQRMGLARALATEPTVLLLDEFTSALDAVTEEKVFRSLRLKGATCIIVAHRLSTVASCDRIYCMDHGKIVESGTHNELMKKDGLYKKLVNA